MIKTNANKKAGQAGAPRPTLTTELARSPFGTPLPVITLEAAPGTHWRVVSASLHRLAATVQEATPTIERWCVVVDQYGDLEGRVYLELAKGEQDEADRGMAVLENVARRGL